MMTAYDTTFKNIEAIRMKADDRKELETNDLAANASELVDRVTSGAIFTPAVVRALALGGALVLVLGVWWYLGNESRKTNSREWASLANASLDELETHGKTYKDSLSGRVARIETARRLIGQEGIRLMTSPERDTQRKGFDNIEAAREEFLKLAEELKNHKTLAASCLIQAAEAELALAGIPRDATGAEKRGTPTKAAELYERVAKLFAADSIAHEKYLKRAEEIRNRADAYEKVGRDLFDRANPVPTIDITPKDGPGVIAPGSLGTEPSTQPLPGEGVAPPVGPITLPPLPPLSEGSVPTTTPPPEVPSTPTPAQDPPK